MLLAQNAIPVENGWRFHGCTPVCVPSPGLASCHVDACSLRILFTGKMPVATKKAICMPETVSDQYSLEVTGRVEDAPIHESLGDVSRSANLSESWHSVHRIG